MSVLKQQKEDCLSKEEKTRHYLEAVFSVAEHISRERDQLLHMVIATAMLTTMQNEFMNLVVVTSYAEQIQAYTVLGMTSKKVMHCIIDKKTTCYNKWKCLSLLIFNQYIIYLYIYICNKFQTHFLYPSLPLFLTSPTCTVHLIHLQ